VFHSHGMNSFVICLFSVQEMDSCFKLVVDVFKILRSVMFYNESIVYFIETILEKFIRLIRFENTLKFNICT